MNNLQKKILAAVLLGIFNVFLFLVDLRGCLQGDFTRYYRWFLCFLIFPANAYFGYLCKEREKEPALQKAVIILAVFILAYLVGELALCYIYRA